MKDFYNTNLGIPFAERSPQPADVEKSLPAGLLEKANFLESANAALDRAIDLTKERDQFKALAKANAEALSSALVEIKRLREGLQYYAEGSHFIKNDEDAWDTVSGEPQNFQEDEAGTATVEDGTVARYCLEGKQIKDHSDS